MSKTVEDVIKEVYRFLRQDRTYSPSDLVSMMNDGMLEIASTILPNMVEVYFPALQTRGSIYTAYSTLDFDAGTTAIVAGDTIIGATSGATGTVGAVSLDSGAWDGTGAGTLSVYDVSGTFEDDEWLNTNKAQVNGTLTSPVAYTSLPTDFHKWLTNVYDVSNDRNFSVNNEYSQGIIPYAKMEQLYPNFDETGSPYVFSVKGRYLYYQPIAEYTQLTLTYYKKPTTLTFGSTISNEMPEPYVVPVLSAYLLAQIFEEKEIFENREPAQSVKWNGLLTERLTQMMYYIGPAFDDHYFINDAWGR